MRDSQSLLEQLLAVGHERITAADVNQLLGIAPAERLSGLVRHLVARDASAALAELDATIQSGVEVGLLLDQLVGYFRDVMTTAVGCPADQMLYALPSQADEVADVGRELGLSTVLAIGQILDHTAARMRVSMHGRTLVEMAIVRICQLGELDDLASLVAELRGTAADQPDKRAAGVDRERAPSSLASGLSSTLATAKKNAEPRLGTAARHWLRLRPAGAKTNHSRGARNTGGNERTSANNWLAAAIHRTRSANRRPPPNVVAAESTPAESVLAQFQRAVANGSETKPATGPPRMSRREQLAQIAEQPFVRRAMELFDVAARPTSLHTAGRRAKLKYWIHHGVHREHREAQCRFKR